MKKQIIRLWKYLSLYEVSYITIDGFAVIIFSFGTNTRVINICIENTTNNKLKLKKVFLEMKLIDEEGFKSFHFDSEITEMPLDYNFKLNVLTRVKGLEDKPFAELVDKAIKIEIDNIPVYFIDYDNLVLAKRLAN